MKAITIYQPFASLIACRAKIYETRSWYTHYRGKIDIHAGLKSHCYKNLVNNDVDFEQLYAEAVIKALSFEDFYFDCNYTRFHNIPKWLMTYNKGVSLLPRGAVIATAELVSCRKIHQNPIDGVHYIFDETDYAIEINGNELIFGDWSAGRYAWELRNVEVFPEPIPAKGQQGLWNWNDNLQKNTAH